MFLEIYLLVPVSDPEFAEGIPDPENIKKAANIIGDLIKNHMSNGNQVSGVTESIVGNCAAGGGKATLSGNDTGSQITASLQFDNFCVVDGSGGYVIMHGLINVSAKYSGDYNYIDFIMSITYLKMSVNDGSTTVSEEFAGTIEITNINPGPPTFSVSVNFKYEGKIFKIVNLAIVEDMSTSPTSISISGTLYHPVHGYVEISTTNDFVYNWTAEQFCDGELTIVGSNGAVPSDTATIVFTANVDCTQYDICVTINPDPEVCVYGVTWGDPAWPAP